MMSILKDQCELIDWHEFVDWIIIITSKILFIIIKIKCNKILKSTNILAFPMERKFITENKIQPQQMMKLSSLSMEILVHSDGGIKLSKD